MTESIITGCEGYIFSSPIPMYIVNNMMSGKNYKLKIYIYMYILQPITITKQ